MGDWETFGAWSNKLAVVGHQGKALTGYPTPCHCDVTSPLQTPAMANRGALGSPPPTFLAMVNFTMLSQKDLSSPKLLPSGVWSLPQEKCCLWWLLLLEMNPKSFLVLLHHPLTRLSQHHGQVLCLLILQALGWLTPQIQSRVQMPPSQRRF